MHKESVDILNKALNSELIAVHQYIIHSKILNEGALYNLAAVARKHSIEEMKHSDVIMDRIFYLKGLPKLEKISGLNFVDDVEKIIKKDLDLEKEAVILYRNSITALEANKDFGSADIMRSLLKDEESHVDWLEQQLALIGRIGMQNYLEKNG